MSGPTECGECRGDTVVRARDAQGRYIADSSPLPIDPREDGTR